MFHRYKRISLHGLFRFGKEIINQIFTSGGVGLMFRGKYETLFSFGQHGNFTYLDIGVRSVERTLAAVR